MGNEVADVSQRYQQYQQVQYQEYEASKRQKQEAQEESARVKQELADRRDELTQEERDAGVQKIINSGKLDFSYLTLDKQKFNKKLERDVAGAEREDIFPDLYGANFQGASLKYAYFDRVRLSEANFRGATLEFASLAKAVLNRADLRKAKLVNANLSNATLVGADLSDSDLNSANLERAVLDQAILRGAGLAGANLTDTSLLGANLAGANLEGARLVNCELEGANLDGARMDRVNLSGTAWWLATGLKMAQIKKLRDAFPPNDLLKSKRYQDDIQQLTRLANETNTAADRAGAQNALAWYRAVRGVELQKAWQDAEAAVEAFYAESLKKSDDARFHLGQALDTRGYISLRLNRLYEAIQTFRESGEAIEKADPVSIESEQKDTVLGEHYYHLYLAYHLTGDSENAGLFKRMADEKRYIPTHELLLE